MRRIMEKGTEFNYLGYTIKMCANNDGIVLISPKGEHFGNYGTDVLLAKKYALLNYMCDNPKMRSSIISRLAESKKGGNWGDFSLLMDCLKKDGFKNPGIKMTKDSNRMIDLKI